MPSHPESERKDRGAERKYWTDYYEAMGLGYNKVLNLVHRRMKNGTCKSKSKV